MLSDVSEQIKDFLDKYSSFTMEEEQDRWILKGLYHLNVNYNEIQIEDYFQLEIHIIKNQKTLPIVYEKRRIGPFHHKFTDGSLCLEVPMKISISFKKNKNNLCLFFEEFVIPYLYGYVYYEMYGVMPFGERSHGENGYIEYFMDIFNLQSKKKLIDFLQYLINTASYRGHHICPCGSNRIIRNCHKDVMFHYFNEENEVVLNEIKKYLREQKNVKSKN